MKMTHEDILGYAVDGSLRELESVKKVFGINHENYKHAYKVYHTLYKLYQKEHLKNLDN